MVPGSYHAFFSGCASVAGTLIGLLFVAISMSPHSDAAGKAPIGFQLQAAVAFTALVNTLVVALVALLPGDNLGTVSVILAGAGISCALGLSVLSHRDRARRRQLQELFIIPVLGVLSVLELLVGTNLVLRPRDPNPLRVLALLMIAFVVIAMARAWKMIGARNTRLVGVVSDLVRERRAVPASTLPQNSERDGSSLRLPQPRPKALP
jgi:lysylphosphatidylglycerol synthetase-like protein (DUF2156 family)